MRKARAATKLWVNIVIKSEGWTGGMVALYAAGQNFLHFSCIFKYFLVKAKPFLISRIKGEFA